MNLKNGKVFRSKFVGTGPSSYEKRIYRAAVSQRLRNTDLQHRSVAIFTAMQSSYEVLSTKSNDANSLVFRNNFNKGL